MNEAGLNAAWLRKDLTHEETQEFAVRVLNHMRERLSDYQDSSVCDADGYILYTTATCPNCRAVKPLLEKSGLCYTERDVDEYIEEATALGLRQAPILAVQSGNKTVLYTGVAQIKAFAQGVVVMTDIAVIGGGPAGLTAALYAARTGKSVTVYERECIGGQITRAPQVETTQAPEGYPACSSATVWRHRQRRQVL